MSSALYTASATIDNAHEDDIWHTCWVPGKHQLASTGADEVVKLWDAQSGECTRTLKDGDFAITSLDINAQGTQLLTSSMDHKMRIWDLNSSGDQSSPAMAIDAQPINAWKARFVPQRGDGEPLLASTTDRGTVKLWSAKRGKEVRELNTSRPKFLYALAVSPDGTKIACAGVDSHIYVFDVESGALSCSFAGHSDVVRSVSFSADSALLVSASDDKQVQVHDARFGSPAATLMGHFGWVVSAEMHANGTYIASASFDAKVKIWDVAQRACVETHNQHAQAVWSVAWQRSSEEVDVPRPMLASAGEDRSLSLYDPLLA
ncbi:hypothetical protein IW139_004031 [Coemansia sp. RSA 353]|nr:hypothetical protein IW142_001755 [Coemansia sp. RSA 564]KAJ2184792.1 hypothetical protein EV181_004189 [Coemansia sp. RSA 532]KAJ2193094.1 hypothetical protein GGH18_002661 [Coemansia sp. RSA 530]KAJ2193629.1 hypothetical protein IW144_004347 [Coemansia sp. RSA 522]KAJ2203444.1 hypothetical protein IW145_004066 [Coemansia sp. RSA 521]KAJ2228049.1 hypothetical protein EV180_002173 [Coemansia sp. RSA 518]KAJ2274183.1 hypothetical protein GGH14_004176 [Coemansia sp. RSA 370]KAJ2295084.1 hyp